MNASARTPTTHAYRHTPTESGTELLQNVSTLNEHEHSILKEARAILLKLASQPRANLISPNLVREYLRTLTGPQEREVFTAIYLDNRHRAIASEILFAGTIDGATVHPREVVKGALKHNAAAVIVSHNHPSGVAEPSQADELITQRLKEALALVDIRLLDHFIVSIEQTVSLAERGVL